MRQDKQAAHNQDKHEQDQHKTVVPDVSMLELLVCPLTKMTLHYDKETNELISEKAKLAYPIKNGIPIMLPSEARIIED